MKDRTNKRSRGGTAPEGSRRRRGEENGAVLSNSAVALGAQPLPSVAAIHSPKRLRQQRPESALASLIDQQQQQQSPQPKDLQHEELRGFFTSELNLFYLCYHVLGAVQLSALKSVNSIFDTTIDQAISNFLFAENCVVAFGENAALRMDDALVILAQLSNFPQIQERMYVKLETVLLQQLSSNDHSFVQRKQRFAEILRNLSRCNHNKLVIYQGRVLPIILDLLWKNHDSEEQALLQITRFVLGTLNNIATLDENAVGLIQRPRFLQTVMDYCEHGKTNTIKERAIWTLQSLACADETEVAMYEMPKLVDVLVNCVCHGATKEIQSYAVETLRNLANQNQQKMRDNEKVKFALLDIVRSDQMSTLKILALSCFQRMGYSGKQVQAFVVMETLCIAREASRCLTNNCYVKNLPVELLRNVAGYLYGSRSQQLAHIVGLNQLDDPFMAMAMLDE